MRAFPKNAVALLLPDLAVGAVLLLQLAPAREFACYPFAARLEEGWRSGPLVSETPQIPRCGVHNSKASPSTAALDSLDSVVATRFVDFPIVRILHRALVALNG